MNKTCYRIIFNQARGMPMAVAETAKSQGKAGAESPAPSRKRQGPPIGAMRLVPLSAWVTGMAWCLAAQAQIAADPGAPGNQRPTVLAAPNKVPLVNIQTPSGAGVSRNTYSQFDIQPQGAILNNSRTNVQTQLGGWVQGNPWLATGGARIILNEIHSSQASALRGYLEVAGPRAQVVIANPAGVTCDGCGFINASRATVTTGTPLLHGGSLEGYRVQGGAVIVAGDGMDASTTDYTDLIARSVQVNAGLWANQLQVIAGSNQVSVDLAGGEPRATAMAAAAGPAPAFAIDVAQLGGMYAGKITLIGTEAGVGVRNAGDLYAGVGEVVVTANGLLHNAGHINGKGQIQIDAQDGIASTGTVHAQGNVDLGTRGDIGNSGVITAQGNVILSATGATSRITSNSGSVLGAGVQADGSLGASGKLAVNATQAIQAAGQNASGGDQAWQAQAIDLGGSQTCARHLSLAASQGDIDLSHATLTVGQAFTAHASQTLRTDAAAISAGEFQASARDWSNVQGDVLQTGAGGLAVNLAGVLDNARGRIAGYGATLDLAAATLLNAAGTLEHAGSGAFHLQAAALDNGGGKIAGNGAIGLAAGTVANRGGAILAAGEAGSDLTLIATGGIDNSQGGSMSASGNATLSATSLDNTQGRITAVHALSVSAAQAIHNRQGLLGANQQVNLSAERIDNGAGAIGSVQGTVHLLAHDGVLDNQAGRIEAAQAVSVLALGITNTDGTIVGKSLAANSRAQAFDNRRGKLAATGAGATDALDLQSGAFNNDGGLIQSASALTVQTHGQLLVNTHAGTSGGIVGQGAVSLHTGDLDNRAGYVGGGGLTVDGAAIANNQGGALFSMAGASLTGSTLDNRGGQIQAAGNLDMALRSLLHNGAGLMRSGQDLSIAAAGLINTHTRDASQRVAGVSQAIEGSQLGIEGNNVTLSAGAIDNSTGAIRAGNNATLTSGVPGNTTLGGGVTLDNAHGLVSAGHTLTVQGAAAGKPMVLTNADGTLIAGRQLTVDGASLAGAGKLESLGDLDVRLARDYVHDGEIRANGHASIATAGTLVNRSLLQAGNGLAVTAAAIDNQAGATMTGADTRLQATGILTNRGLIDGQTTTVAAGALHNLGTGRLYGDQVAIAATTLVNAAEDATGAAPVIAARERLDIGAATIDNREQALLLSMGDLAIGASLDANQRATGSAALLTNASATIDAAGKADISARHIRNTDLHFATETGIVSAQAITEYQGAGSPNRYTPDEPGVALYKDESDHLHTPEGDYERWSAYRYTRTITETRVASAAPAQILAGGELRLTADTVDNDKSHIIAGGAITGKVGTLINAEVAGEHAITDTGTVTAYWRKHEKGRDPTGWQTAPYAPAPAIQAISLKPGIYLPHTAPGGTGKTIEPLARGMAEQAPEAVNPALPARQSGQAITAMVQVAVADSGKAGGPASVVRSGGINTRLPNNSLFRAPPSPTAHYLVETDPAFANYRAWLSSDYLLDALSLDPARTQKRLGDGFYEQKLIREQVAQLTGRRFLDGYASDEAQYQALLDQAATYARAWHLIPGVALSAAQMAQLTSDMVWLVEQDVVLANGGTAKALVPQLYVRLREGDLQAGGALIAGNSVNLELRGDLVNSGTIAGRDMVALTAENVKNLGGRITGGDVGLAARIDLDNIGGDIIARHSLAASAGRDLNVISTTRTQQNAQGSQTNIARVAGLYVTGQGGTLLASAGRDARLVGAAILNAGAAAANAPAAADASAMPAGAIAITAGNNLTLGTVTQGESHSLAWDGNNRRSDASTQEVGTSIQSQGKLTLLAGKDLTGRAANITSSQGEVFAMAGNDVNFTAGQDSQTVDEAHRHKSRSGFLSSKTVTTRDTLEATAAQASTLSGQTVTVLAKHDLAIIGSQVVSDNGTVLVARNALDILAATDTRSEDHFRKEKQSGLLGTGGVGFTIGTRQQSVDQQGATATAAASRVGSTQGQVTLLAGGAYRQVGSDVLAPQGDVAIQGKTVKIVEARETARHQTETRFKQSGLTVALSNPVIGAIQTAQQMRQAASDTQDPRMQVLAAASTALAANNAADAVKAGQGSTINGKEHQIPTGQANPDGTPETRDATLADKAGGINLNLSLGSASSQSHSTQSQGMASGSNVAAGNNLSIIASGGGAASDLLIQGSAIKAGNLVTLDADNELQLLAARNMADQHGASKNQSGSLGVSIGTDGLMLAASASGARGRADGSDTAWSNTHVEAGRQVVMRSGGDATLKGAVVAAPRITADIGGQLHIESLQDTSSYDSRQHSLGGSIAVGYGKMSGSMNASQSRIDSDFSSVAEQSGLRAGDQGFQVKVGGDTTLAGGAITSTQQAVGQGNNAFDTGGALVTADIHNQASYSAKSAGVSLGTGFDPNGKLAPGGTSAGVGQASGRANSTTQAAISGIAGNREARTGDAQSGIQPIFDAGKAQKEVDAQVRITQTFGREAGQAAASYAAGKAAELKARQQAQSDPAQRQALQDEQRKWEEGGAYRIALHAATGGLAGGIAGALGSSAAAAAAPLLNDWQGSIAASLGHAGASGNVAKTAAQLIAGATAAGIGAVASGGTAAGAATAFNADANNRQLHMATFNRLREGCRSSGSTECQTINQMAGVRSGMPADDPNIPASKVVVNYDASGNVASYVLIDRATSLPTMILEPLDYAAYRNGSPGTQAMMQLSPQYALDFASAGLYAAVGDNGRAAEHVIAGVTSRDYVRDVALGTAGAAISAIALVRPTTGLAANSGLLDEAAAKGARNYIDILSPHAKQHILYGDGLGSGGHLWPGQSGKTVFPQNWSADKVIHEIGDIATSPTTQWYAQTGTGGVFTKVGDPAKWVAYEIRDGVRIRVVYEPATGKVITGFPDNNPAPAYKLIK